MPMITQDPQGRMLCLATRANGERPLIEMRTKRLLGALPAWNGIHPEMAPDARLFGFPYAGKCFFLYRRDGWEPLVKLDAEGGPSEGEAVFDSAGARVAWGTSYGSVIVCDIAEVQRRLADVGLGW